MTAFYEPKSYSRTINTGSCFYLPKTMLKMSEHPFLAFLWETKVTWTSEGHRVNKDMRLKCVLFIQFATGERMWIVESY